MMGYVNMKYHFLKIKDKNYYNTGDLVKIDKGQIYWLSRNDDMIKKKGLKIFTTEIDEIVENKNKNIISKTILINEDLLLFYKGNSVKNDISKSIKENLPSLYASF